MRKDNLLCYLREYRQKSFLEVPFSQVDALVLSQLSYLKMNDIVPGFGPQRAISWEEMNSHPASARMFSDLLYGETYREIFRLVEKSVRYGKIKVNYFVEWLNEEKEIQFAAVTFFLGPSSIFVSYRGTDDTLVGWKEDFNMGYMHRIPSQKMALDYLKGAARYTKGRMILGGHSKGGNLAVYAAARAPLPVQQRLSRIYSFDGPGFHKDFYATAGFARIKNRFFKVVPEESLVGMLFSNYQDYHVVESYGKGLIQHDLLQWKIREGKFVFCRQLYRRSGKRVRKLNNWIDSLSRRQAAEYVEVLYGLFLSARINSVYDLLKRPVYHLGRIRKALGNMEKGRRKMVLEVFARIAGLAGGEK